MCGGGVLKQKQVWQGRTMRSSPNDHSLRLLALPWLSERDYVMFCLTIASLRDVNSSPSEGYQARTICNIKQAKHLSRRFYSR